MKATINISSTLLDSLLKNKYILDYTDDGFVLHDNAGWIPVGDVLEYILLTEEDNSEEGLETQRLG